MTFSGEKMKFQLVTRKRYKLMMSPQRKLNTMYT